jgi:hypothetical protein
MRINQRLRRVVACGAIVLASATGAAGIPAGIASAASNPASARVFDAQGCSGDTCIYLAGNSGGTALVEAWAYSSNFYGHFYLSGPGVGVTSPTQTWYAHKGNYWSVSVSNAAAGRYCMSGYSSSGGYEGTACETLK